MAHSGFRIDSPPADSTQQKRRDISPDVGILSATVEGGVNLQETQKDDVKVGGGVFQTNLRLSPMWNIGDSFVGFSVGGRYSVAAGSETVHRLALLTDFAVTTPGVENSHYDTVFPGIAFLAGVRPHTRIEQGQLHQTRLGLGVGGSINFHIWQMLTGGLTLDLFDVTSDDVMAEGLMVGLNFSASMPVALGA